MSATDVTIAGEEEEFADDARGWARRWAVEFAAAKEEVKRWHEQAERIIKRFLDERDALQDTDTRWNLFTANVQTVRAIMYGKTPSVSVTRRFNDTQDDVARVAGVMLERLLNADIERASDGYKAALQHGLDDYLLAGLGNNRVRYVADFETQQVEAQTHPETGAELAPAYSHEVKAHEDAETDYVYWRDQLWGQARVFGEVPWWAFRAQMTRKELVKRFGEEVGKKVPLNSKRNKSSDDTDAKKSDPWSRADVWEVWCKEDKRVYWYVEGYAETLDIKDDTLGLEGFWPFPRPMFANLTTSKLLPRPDFILAQDLYNEVDITSTRIQRLIEAVKVVGVYDQTSTGLQSLLKGSENKMVPVENWAMFVENGGVKGQIDWMPLDMVIQAILQLREHRTETIAAANQITGMSDIVRGQAQTSTTATEQSIKAKFASVRLQSLQDEFARFASDVQRLRAEVICKHFDAQTILQRSNILQTADAQLAQPAVELLKSEYACYRVEVKPEAVSLTDYAALKQERTEVMQAIGGFVQSVTPLAMQSPALAPMLMELLQWMLAGLKGGQEIEGILDAAIAQQKAAAAQPQPPPPPDPKLEATQMKGQMDMQRAQFDHQASLQQIQAQAQADTQHQVAQTHFNIIEAQAKERAKTLDGIDRAVNPAGTRE